MRAMAEMSDLDLAIREQSSSQTSSSGSSTIDQPLCVNHQFEQNDSSNEFFIGEHVVGLFTDGYYPGEVIKIDEETLTIDFLAPVHLKQNYTDASLWKKPSKSLSDVQQLEKCSILPIRPVLRLSKCSNRRIVIYELINADLIEKFN